MSLSYETVDEARDGDEAALQALIDSGAAWKLEGSVGRAAMAALETGACHLPAIRHVGAYGQIIPRCFDLVDGTTGTLGLWRKYHELPEGTMPAGMEGPA